MELETGKNISEKFRPGRFETTAYVVDKDHYLTLPWGRRILCSWNSRSNFSFLRQGADTDHSVQLFLGDPGTSLVASGKLFGHCETKSWKRNVGLQIIHDDTQDAIGIKIYRYVNCVNRKLIQ